MNVTCEHIVAVCKEPDLTWTDQDGSAVRRLLSDRKIVCVTSGHDVVTVTPFEAFSRDGSISTRSGVRIPEEIDAMIAELRRKRAKNRSPIARQVLASQINALRWVRGKGVM